MGADEDLNGAGLAVRPAGQGDVTTDLLPSGATGQAAFAARSAATVCGLPLIPVILEAFGGGVRFDPAVEDGTRVAPGRVLGVISGSAAAILRAERLMLNFLQYLSGVAGQTARYVQALGDSSTRLLDTRKTTPGYRALDKYAVACGGGWNHRLGLFDRILIKDNHLAAAPGTIGDFISRARERHPGSIIEAEVDKPEQIEPALAGGADVILLDNFSISGLKSAVEQIDGRACTEASGGITLESLPRIGRLGLDFISCGALVHQSAWADIGLDWSRRAT